MKDPRIKDFVSTFQTKPSKAVILRDNYSRKYKAELNRIKKEI